MHRWRTLAVAVAGAAMLALAAPGPVAASQPAAAVPPAAAERGWAAQAAPVSPLASYSRCGNSTGRTLLTFDDWAYADPYRATRTGAYLRSRNIRAMFFLINDNARKYPDIVSTLRQQGHWVLNHSYGHPDLTTLSNANLRWQIANGVRSNVLRPPYGAWNSRVQSTASSLGYRLCTWTIDTVDWQQVNGQYRSTSSIRSIVRNSAASAKSNGVILGHLFSRYPDAVGGIIDDLHAQGYLFCRNRGPVGSSAPDPLTCT
jgi:peptidoglycan/xylan/chitin deacetylase (PgdA/CDA1 family)